ncbi:MAG: Cof-type HAD-IIB family hydrolase [Spirochaetes bacterium]|nr:Cof-type HAD-IIB family hydrolase [Spirochaetota bacterium]
MPVRLIALDLDDTLLRSDLSISDIDRTACRAALEAGIPVVLASGRNIHSMEKYARELGIMGSKNHMISTNGAEIIELERSTPVRETRITPALCREIADELDCAGFPFQLYENGVIHVSRKNGWTDEDTRLTGQPNRLIENREALFAKGQLKFIVPADPHELDRLMPSLKARFRGRLEILVSKPYFLEVLPSGTDKGLALAWLGGILGIRMEDMLAAGDAMNDLGMVSAVGSGCAPANAIPAIRTAASYVSPFTNDENAVADIITRHLG